MAHIEVMCPYPYRGHWRHGPKISHMGLSGLTTQVENRPQKTITMHTSQFRHRWLVVLLVATAVGTAGCGSSESPNSSGAVAGDLPGSGPGSNDNASPASGDASDIPDGRSSGSYGDDTSESTAPCAGDSALGCGTFGSIAYGASMTINGVETIVRLRDTNDDGVISPADDSWQLYRKLLGPRFEVPAMPLVRFVLNDLRLGTEAPGAQDAGPAEYDGRYIEFGVELLAQYGNEVAWRDIRLWLNNRAGFETGRAGGAPKFLADMVYEQSPDRVEGYMTSYAGENEEAFVFRADWAPLSVDYDPRDASAEELRSFYHDPSPITRIGDGTEGGNAWTGGVGLGHFTALPAAPFAFATGQNAPFPDPTAATPVPVYVRIQIDADFDQFNTPPAANQALSDPDPLPDMFDESMGESWAMLIDTDQEATGRQYGPFQANLVVESEDVTAQGPCADTDSETGPCAGGPYRDERG